MIMNSDNFILNGSTTFGCGCHVVGDFTVKGNTKTTGKDYLKKLYTKEQIIGMIKDKSEFIDGYGVRNMKNIDKYSKESLVDILFTIGKLEESTSMMPSISYSMEIKDIIKKEEEELAYDFSKRISELELESYKINKEIELTPKEKIKHKIEMLNKKNKVEIELAELIAEI